MPDVVRFLRRVFESSRHFESISIEALEEPNECILHVHPYQENAGVGDDPTPIPEEMLLAVNWDEEKDVMSFTHRHKLTIPESKLGIMYELMNIYNLRSDRTSRLAARPYPGEMSVLNVFVQLVPLSEMSRGSYKEWSDFTMRENIFRFVVECVADVSDFRQDFEESDDDGKS